LSQFELPDAKKSRHLSPEDLFVQSYLKPLQKEELHRSVASSIVDKIHFKLSGTQVPSLKDLCEFLEEAVTTVVWLNEDCCLGNRIVLTHVREKYTLWSMCLDFGTVFSLETRLLCCHNRGDALDRLFALDFPGLIRVKLEFIDSAVKNRLEASEGAFRGFCEHPSLQSLEIFGGNHFAQ